MPDAYVVFRKRIPFEVRLDNGQVWHVFTQTGMKSGYLVLVAAPRFKIGGRNYILAAGKERQLERDLAQGIRVASGTPERGLVTAMRRAGVVILLPEPLPPIRD